MLLTFGIFERARNHGKKSPNLVPRATDSEPLFQLSSQKSTLVQGSLLWQYLKLAILDFGCRTLCCSLLFCHFVSPWMVKYFVVHMHQMNSRDKERSLSNQVLKAILFRIGEFLPVPRIETITKWKRSRRNSFWINGNALTLVNKLSGNKFTRLLQVYLVLS